MPSPDHPGFSRRTLARGAAWGAPIVAVAATAPPASASSVCEVTLAVKCPGGGNFERGFTMTMGCGNPPGSFSLTQTLVFTGVVGQSNQVLANAALTLYIAGQDQSGPGVVPSAWGPSVYTNLGTTFTVSRTRTINVSGLNDGASTAVNYSYWLWTGVTGNISNTLTGNPGSTTFVPGSVSFDRSTC